VPHNQIIMSDRPRIYLDNAATSFPKPEAVFAAVDHYNRNVGAAVGRGAYSASVEVQGTVNRCRKQAADFFGAESPDCIIFTFNGTDSLNLALHGLLKQGDHVVASKIEHNSVLRPLRELQLRKGIEVSYVDTDATGRIEPADVKAALRPNTKLIALIHASNVTGTIQPIADVGEIARNAGVLFLVDAAQSAGHLPIDLRNLPVDLLACPGHKGLLGPLGTGLLYIRPGIETQLESIRQGGTGSQSEDDQQPETLPDKYESGNHNAPGLYGLETAFGYLQERGIKSLRAHEQQLTTQLLNGLSTIPKLELFGPKNTEEQVGVVSVSLPGFDPQILSTILDENFSIQTRAGLHCAPGVHKSIGTFETGGTVRLSTGPFTTAEDIDTAVAALREIAGKT
jgi:cysteine desulfurase/selenocysteine lyase